MIWERFSLLVSWSNQHLWLLSLLLRSISDLLGGGGLLRAHSSTQSSLSVCVHRHGGSRVDLEGNNVPAPCQRSPFIVRRKQTLAVLLHPVPEFRTRLKGQCASVLQGTNLHRKVAKMEKEAQGSSECHKQFMISRAGDSCLGSVCRWPCRG